MRQRREGGQPAAAVEGVQVEVVDREALGQSGGQRPQGGRASGTRPAGEQEVLTVVEVERDERLPLLGRQVEHSERYGGRPGIEAGDLRRR